VGRAGPRRQPAGLGAGERTGSGLDRDSPVTDASTYSIFVGARSNQDLIQVDDPDIAWDWDSRNQL
jgi:hypothetical protein